MDTEYKISSSKLETLPIIGAQCCVNLTRPKNAVPTTDAKRSRSFIERYKLIYLAMVLFAILLLSFFVALIYLSYTPGYLYQVEQVHEIDQPGRSAIDDLDDRHSYELLVTDQLLDSNPELRSFLSNIQPDRNRLKRDVGSVPCELNAEHCKTVIDSMLSIVSIVNTSMPHIQALLPTFSNDPPNGSKSKLVELVECLQCKNDSIAFVDESSPTTVVNDHPVAYEHSDHAQIWNNMDIVTNLLNNDNQRNETSTSANDQATSKHPEGVQESKVSIFGDNRDELLKTTTMEPETTVSPSGFTETINASTGASTLETEEGNETKRIDDTEQTTVTVDVSTKSDGGNVTEIANSTVEVHPSVHPSDQGHAEHNESEAANGSEGTTQPSFNENLKGRVVSNNRYQLTGNQDLSRGMNPTAETMKSTQQLELTPTMSLMHYPVCMYGSPPNSGGKQSAPDQFFYPISSPGANYPMFVPQQRPGFPNSANQAPNYVQVQAQSVHLMPMSPFPGQPGPRVGPTGPGPQNFPMFPGHQSSPSGGARGLSKPPYYCTYIPVPTLQFPAVPGVSEYQRSSDASKDNAEAKDVAKDGGSDGQMLLIPRYPKRCPFNTIRCGDGEQCILRSQWCDGHVDCSDAGDETTCSCRDRISQERLCDGYFDCPHGEDELGCLGCSKTSFSCNDWQRRYSSDNCVPLSQRCDGIRQCSNGKDEMDCNILTPTYIAGKNVFTIGYTEGYLHKNYKGQWYPVCTAVDSWARDACASEIGLQASGQPEIKIHTVPDNAYESPYLAEVDGQMELVPSCINTAVHVRCPPFPCGTRVLSRQDSLRPLVLEKEDQDALRPLLEDAQQLYEIGNGTSSDKEDDIVGSQLRVVGGRASRPKAWPFLAAIHMDGNFHCGGVVLNELWILTAAHCLDGYQGHYYEIQVGMLRRFSFSPMAQSRKARYTIVHPGYSSRDMANDIGMIMLDDPLRFNRWVRPVCLPGLDTLGFMWRMKPEPNSTCIAIGWGATREHGLDPDHLREVEVPILEKCKYDVDRTEASICAGYPQGGRDACQGDSGGPLMCRTTSSESQWYVAGIVSHGEGCGRPDEPGAYTKVSYFQEWIQEISSGRGLPPLKRTPLEKCPGFSCEGGLGKCLPIEARCNREVDCLDGEDEVNCLGHLNYPRNRPFDSESQLVNPAAKQSSTSSENLLNNGTTRPVTVNYSLSVDEETNQVEYNTVDDTNIMTHDFVDARTDDPLPTTTVVSAITFSCTRLLQTIPFDKRCDRIVDCEDGTDEANCTCKDFLSSFKPTAICDGYADCYDQTDEEYCELCGPDEFFCRGSKTCIPSSRKCDGRFDCEFKEDELDCFTLSNGRYVYLDADGRPSLNMRGVLTGYVNGKWQPTCHRARMYQNQSTATLIGQNICEYFGFANLQSSEEVSVRDSELETIAWNEENMSDDVEPSRMLLPTDDKTCSGLYIRCRPVFSGTVNTHLAVDPTTGSRVYLWPWLAAIFVDGSYRCSAILLDRDWLLSVTKCVENVRLEKNYTTAVLGYGPLYRYVNGPHQQISIVDEVQPVNNSVSVLLHLKNQVNVTRHVRPLFLEKTIYLPGFNDTCVAVGTDKDFETKSIFLRPILQNCQSCQRCFVNASISECSENEESDWSGTIFCHGKKGWYPAAAFEEKNGPCSFRSIQTLTSIDHVNPYLMEAIDSTRLSVEAECNGFRCSLGKCISQKQVCDGVPDCRDKADEDPKYCEQVRETCENSVDDCTCTKSELRCRNGRCVDKSAFCDGNNDCTDESDEPKICTCAEYLKLTAPERLCDGVRHCLDKTDESPETCPCRDDSFRCEMMSGNDTCIPKDFICDGDKDCTNGHDETTCTLVKQLPGAKAGIVEVIRRSYGFWHPECLSDPVASTEEASNLCRTMGYSSGDVANDTMVIDEPVIPKRDDFHVVRVNDWTWLTLRNDKPLITLVKPEKTCYSTIVSCV